MTDPEGYATAWLAIWHDGTPVPLASTHATPAPGLCGLWLEGRLPRPGRVPLRLWQGQGAETSALAIYLLPDGAVWVVQGEVDCRAPAGHVAPRAPFRLRYQACAEARHGFFGLDDLDSGARHVERLPIPVPAEADALEPSDPRFLPQLRVAALAAGPLPAPGLPGFAPGTPVATPDGLRPVETIRPGDQVLDLAGTAHVVRWRAGQVRLCFGHGAPRNLRAPYFGLDRDLCVTADTRILRRGVDVEYLAGADRALVRARDLPIGPWIRRDTSRPVRPFHTLLLDDPVCLGFGRCGVETATLAEVLAADPAAPMGALAAAAAGDAALPVLDRAAARALGAVA